MRVLGLTMPDGVKRFCDARCHNSTNPRRKCICGGLLRGKGEHYAKLMAPQVQYYVHSIRKTKGPVWLNPALAPDRRP